MTPHPRIRTAAVKHTPRMVRLLRELVAIPSPTSHEQRVVERIQCEIRSLGIFRRTWRDGFGNLFAQLGNGRRLIAIDAHLDTVGVGDPREWKHDPYRGKLARGAVWGRGAGDQKGAVPAMLCAARIIADLDLLPRDVSLLLCFTVSEEDCEGLSWQYILRETKLRPDCAIVTDASDCRIVRGQRGRMEIGVTARGRSCHASMPSKGDNAVYKAARVIREIESLNGRLRDDAFLGRATIAATYVDCRTPSRCAIPAQAFVHIDRRLTIGDTRASALREVRDAVRRAGVRAEVGVLSYAAPTCTGLVYPSESYFPTWCEPADAPPVSAAVNAYRALFGVTQRPGRWTFSTNGVAIAGMFGVPCVGFGPGVEAGAHTVHDRVPIRQLTTAAAFYAAFALHYVQSEPRP